jgi:hypothetical protein
MTAYMIVFRPNRPKRLKAGGHLYLPIALHKNKKKSMAELAKLPHSEEGYYFIEPWHVHE